MFAAPCRKAISVSVNSPSDRLSTSSTPYGSPSPCKMTFIARRTPCTARSSGVLNRSSLSKWFDITGSPVRSAKPDGDARSAPTRATPTRPSCQPTPARIKSRFSDAIYSNTLQNSACRPSAATRTVSFSSSANGVPLKATTPSSAKSSCWRIRCSRARPSICDRPSPCGGAPTTGFVGWGISFSRRTRCRVDERCSVLCPCQQGPPLTELVRPKGLREDDRARALSRDTVRITCLKEKWYTALSQHACKRQRVTDLKAIVENRCAYFRSFDETDGFGNFACRTHHCGSSRFKNALEVQRDNRIILND